MGYAVIKDAKEVMGLLRRYSCNVKFLQKRKVKHRSSGANLLSGYGATLWAFREIKLNDDNKFEERLV